MIRRVLRFVFRGPTPYRRLRVIEGRLHGKVARDRYEPLEPASISAVREYMAGQTFISVNAFLVVVSDHKKYGVSVYDDDFEKIVDLIEENTAFEIRSRFVHRYNKLLRTPLSLSRLLFFWRKKGGR